MELKYLGTKVDRNNRNSGKKVTQKKETWQQKSNSEKNRFKKISSRKKLEKSSSLKNTTEKIARRKLTRKSNFFFNLKD